MYQKLNPIFGTEENCVKRIADNAVVPFDPDNTDYQAFLLWKSEGNEPTAVDSE